MKRALGIGTVMILLAACSPSSDQDSKLEPVTENTTETPEESVEEFTLFFKGEPTQKEIDIFWGYLRSESSDVLAAFAEGSESLWACKNSCENPDSTESINLQNRLDQTFTNVEELRVGLEHLKQFDIDHIQHVEIDSVLRSLTYSQDVIKHFKETKHQLTWREQADMLGSARGIVKGLNIELSGV